jgi:putative transposase
MADLGKNDVLQAVTEPPLLKGLVRVLWVDRRSDQIVLITIEPSPKRPWVMRLSDLKTWLSAGDIKTITMASPTYMLKVEDDLSDKEKAFRDNNWARIQPLVDTDPPDEIFQPGSMGRMVSDQALKLEIPKKTLYLRIPRHSDTQPTLIRTPVPRPFGQAVGAQRRRGCIVSLRRPAPSISSPAFSSIRP